MQGPFVNATRIVTEGLAAALSLNADFVTDVTGNDILSSLMPPDN